MVIKRKFYILIIVIVTVFIAGFYSHRPIQREINQLKSHRKTKLQERALSENFLNKKAPDITSTTLDGKEWNLNDQRGKTLFVFFWVTWSRYCRENIPDVKRIYEKYRNIDDFLMIGVSVDKDKDMLHCYCLVKELPWLQLYEEKKGWKNSFAQAFDIHSIPSIWIIDKEGRIIGINLEVKEAEELLNDIFSKSKEAKEGANIRQNKDFDRVELCTSYGK